MYTQEQIESILKEELESQPNIETVYFNEAGEWTMKEGVIGFNTSKSRNEILGNEVKQNLKTNKNNK